MSGPGMEHVTVPVTGGDLFVARWGSGPPVLAVHGITGSHAAWPWVADRLAGAVNLIAPDLRGRGASNALAGPFGMAAHATDLVAVLDHLEVTRAVVVGHSMGAWVGATLAARYPERVNSLLLVDGGLPQTLPEGVDLETHAAAVLGPALSRLERTFSSETAYLAFWRAHPAFAAPGAWDAHLERYVRWDLEGEAPELRPRASRAGAPAAGATRSAEPAGAVPVRQFGDQAPADHSRRPPRGRGGDEPLHAGDGRRRRGDRRPHPGGRAR